MSNPVQSLIDYIVAPVWLAATLIFKVMPVVAVVIPVVWYSIQIYESKTFKGWLKRCRERRLEKLKRRVAKMEKY